jgi:nucleoside-diphosphate-sugar epimerase
MKQSGNKKIRINKIGTITRTARALYLICKNGISGKDGVFLGGLTLDGTTNGTPRKLLDSTLISELGWSPKIDLEQGIAATYEWFLENHAGVAKQ